MATEGHFFYNFVCPNNTKRGTELDEFSEIYAWRRQRDTQADVPYIFRLK